MRKSHVELHWFSGWMDTQGLWLAGQAICTVWGQPNGRLGLWCVCMFGSTKCGGLGAMYTGNTSTACGSKASVNFHHIWLLALYFFPFESLILLFIESKIMSFSKKFYFCLYRCYLVSLMKRQTTNQCLVFSSDSWYLGGYEPKQDSGKKNYVKWGFTKNSILLLVAVNNTP